MGLGFFQGPQTTLTFQIMGYKALAAGTKNSIKACHQISWGQSTRFLKKNRDSHWMFGCNFLPPDAYLCSWTLLMLLSYQRRGTCQVSKQTQVMLKIFFLISSNKLSPWARTVLGCEPGKSGVFLGEIWALLSAIYYSGLKENKSNIFMEQFRYRNRQIATLTRSLSPKGGK